MSSLLGYSGVVAAAAVGAAPAGGAGDVGVPAGWQPGAAQAGGDGRAVLRLSGGEGGGHPRGAGRAPGVGPGGGEPVAGGGAGQVRGDGGESAHAITTAKARSASMRRTVTATAGVMGLRSLPIIEMETTTLRASQPRRPHCQAFRVLMLRFSRPGLAPKWRPPGLIAAGRVARRGRRRRRRGPHRGSCKSRGHLVQVPYEAGGGPLAGSGPASTLGQRVAGAEHLECPGLPRFLPPVVLGPELHGPFVAAGSDGHRAAGEREDVRLIVYGHLVAVHLEAGHDAAAFRPGRCAAMYRSRARSVIRCGSSPVTVSAARSQGLMPRTAHAWSRGTVRHRPGTARTRYGVTTHRRCNTGTTGSVPHH